MANQATTSLNLSRPLPGSAFSFLLRSSNMSKIQCLFTLVQVLCLCVFAATAQPHTYAIVHVNVIPMTSAGEVLTDATVVVEDGKIVTLHGPIPQGARIIDGKG